MGKQSYHRHVREDLCSVWSFALLLSEGEGQRFFQG